MKESNNMQTLEVDLGARGYPIHVGAGVLERADLLKPHIKSRQVMVVTNETVAPLYLDALHDALSGFEVHVTVLKDGEEHKTLATSETIFESLLKAPCDRRVTLVALGGGVVGDITGFVAGCYQRGVAFIQAPTTLLAQVDSSVGGKTAVNSRLGKNMIGLFHQPRCVIADTATLGTLPRRELAAGAAEVIKTALLGDAGFFAWLEEHLEALLELDPAVTAETIGRCCRIKADVVAADEREHGVRALLNLGHTFGHAIETGLGHGAWLHGEAVAAGLCMAAHMSSRCGMIARGTRDRVVDLVRRAGLPTRGPARLSTEELLGLMRVDKKTRDGNVRLVLLQEIGRARLVEDYDPRDLRATIEEQRS